MEVPAIAPVFVHSSQKRRKNVWYTIGDGVWTNPNIWISNAMSLQRNSYNYPGQTPATPAYPQLGDDVYINHTVTFIAGTTIVVNNLYISGNLLFESSGITSTLSINGDLQATGQLNLTSTGIINVYLHGVNNFVNTFTSTNTGNMLYARNGGDQPIMNLPYGRLTTTNRGTKYATSNITTTGILQVGGTVAEIGVMEMGDYDLDCGSTFQVFEIFRKSGAGNILWRGAATTGGGSIFLTGNPTVEIRNGYNWGNGTVSSGTGQWSFTTNNQSITQSGGSNTTISGNILIVGPITVTQSATLVAGATLNGTDAASTFNNTGYLSLATNTTPMTTGVWNFIGYSNNIIGYNFNGAFVVPYTNYQGLVLGGTGAKTFSGNTTMTSFSNNANTDFGTNNITVNGITTNASNLAKTGAGSILFNGLFQQYSAGFIDFSGGNPTVEFRNGWVMTGGSLATGTGQLTASTANQTWNLQVNLVFNAPVLISGAITLTFVGLNATNCTFNGVIDGNNAASTFRNSTTIAAGTRYTNAVMPMVTGLIDMNTTVGNVFKYSRAGNQDVKGGTYRTIEFAVSGDKTLQDNVISTARSTTGTAVLVLNGFTITP